MRRPEAPDAVLLDLGGVLYVEDEPVPGAREAVAAPRDRGMALRFVTNTTTLPAAGSSSAWTGSTATLTSSSSAISAQPGPTSR